jgi:thiol-disulfide isomerase/thioredoxin
MRWLLLLALGCAPAVSAPAQLPTDVALHGDDGESTTIADRILGHPAVIDFWASWCKQCVTSVPKVERLAGAFDGTGLVVVGIAVGDSAAVARATAARLGIAYPIYVDPDLSISERVGATDIPLLLVVDASGKIVHRSRTVDRETLAAIHALVGR